MKKYIKLHAALLVAVLMTFSMLGCSDTSSLDTDADSFSETDGNGSSADNYEMSELFDNGITAEVPTVIKTQPVPDMSAESLNVPATAASAVIAAEAVSSAVDTPSQSTVQSVSAITQNGDSVSNDTVTNKSAVVSEASASEVSFGNSETDTYVINKNTRKFHYASCASCETIKEKNKATGSNRDEIISQGYQPCKRCNP